MIGCKNEMKRVKRYISIYLYISYQGRLLRLCMSFGLEEWKQILGSFPQSSQGMHRFHCRQSIDPIESL